VTSKILLIDDRPANLTLLSDILAPQGYVTLTATTGEEGLARIKADSPDLVLLDVNLAPAGMSGYDVCRAIRNDAVSAMLPVVLITAQEEGSRAPGLEAGADDFIRKTPVDEAELLARVRSLLRVKDYYDKIQAKDRELVELNRTLERRVQEGAAELERVNGLKRFFSPSLVKHLTAEGNEGLLKSHRRNIVVVTLDLRGFTAFAAISDPEEVMQVLRAYHQAMGKLIMKYEGTIEHFAGDGIMIFFNDPVEVEDAPERAARMALEMRDSFALLNKGWVKRGHNLNLGIGIAQGYATIGMIGFEGRWDYSAIGTVCNLSARLCGEAKGGQILVHQRLLAEVNEELFDVETIPPVVLKGFPEPQPVTLLVKDKASRTEVVPTVWDVFVSHASEDKEAFARPLAEGLRAKGLRVWFDEFTLKVGDSLRGSIDRGLAASMFGVVIISPAFLQKDWPQRELDGMVAREIGGKKVMLPVWYNIDPATVSRYSPTLADRLATTSAKGLERVIQDLLTAIGR
jgi:adenylate cyclase